MLVELRTPKEQHLALRSRFAQGSESPENELIHMFRTSNLLVLYGTVEVQEYRTFVAEEGRGRPQRDPSRRAMPMGQMFAQIRARTPHFATVWALSVHVWATPEADHPPNVGPVVRSSCGIGDWNDGSWTMQNTKIME